MTCRFYGKYDCANDGETCKTGGKYCEAYRQYNTLPLVGLRLLVLWLLSLVIAYIGGKLL